MLIKQIYDEYGLPIERIINKEYKRLGLKLSEAMVLLALFSIYERRRTFTINMISRRVEYNRDEIGDFVSQLVEKGFLTIELEETKDGKEREVFNLDKTLLKIEKLIVSDYEEKKKQQSASHVGKMISLLEGGLGRVLSAYEMDLLRNWYLNRDLTHNQIESEINKALKQSRFSIKQIDQVLMARKVDDREVDADTAQTLKQLYQKIKWKGN